MKNAIGLINLNENDTHLHEIVTSRPLAALPFGGRYRLIDFALSNMVNSGITNVGILVQCNYRSLLDHLRSGKEWDLARKRGGLFFLPPAQGQVAGGVRGDMEHFHSHLDYIRRSGAKYAVITGSNIVCNLSFEEPFAFHREMGADITVLYSVEKEQEELGLYTCLTVDPEGRVTDMDVNPASPQQSPNKSLHMYILEIELLIHLVEGAIARGEYDFVKDGLIKNLGRLRVCGYEYSGYRGRIYSVRGYFRRHMDLLRPEVCDELFGREGLVYTKVKDEPPAKYLDNARVVNSLVANGCVVDGYVENCVLFRGVRVGRGAQIRNSVIMQKSVIGDGTSLEYVICDKEVTLTASKRLAGDPGYPVVLRKGTVI